MADSQEPSHVHNWTASKVTYLLLQPHNLEPLEIAQLLALDTPLPALREVRAGPLALDVVLVPLLLQRRTADASGQLGDDDAGERHVGEFGGVAGDVVLFFV